MTHFMHVPNLLTAVTTKAKEPKITTRKQNIIVASAIRGYLPNNYLQPRQFLLFWIPKQLKMSKDNKQLLHADSKSETD